MPVSTRRTKTFGDFLTEATSRDLDSTKFEQDIVNAWNAWATVERRVGQAKVSSAATVRAKKITQQMLSIKPQVPYQSTLAQRIAGQIAWQLRYDDSLHQTPLQSENKKPAQKDTGAGERAAADIITKPYRDAGVLSATSKSDILLGDAQCSMKNANDAQFGSMQHGELTAVIAACWPEKSRNEFKTDLKQTMGALLDKTVFYEIAKSYAEQPEVIDRVVRQVLNQPAPPPGPKPKGTVTKFLTLKDIKNKDLQTKAEKQLQVTYQNDFSRRIAAHSTKGPLTPAEEKVFDAFLGEYASDARVQVLDKLKQKLTTPAFKKAMMLEIMSGRGRFTPAAKEKIATHILLWNPDGGVRVYEIEDYVKQHYTAFQYSIRDRGSRRGGSFRAAVRELFQSAQPDLFGESRLTEDIAPLSRTNAMLLEEFRTRLDLQEREMFLDEGVGSWITTKANELGTFLSTSAATAKAILTDLWGALKSFVLKLWERVLTMLDTAFTRFCDVFGIEFEDTKLTLPPEAIPAPPTSVQVMDLSGVDDTPTSGTPTTPAA